MGMNPDRLIEVEVVDMPADELAAITDRIIPSFCYDNSLVAAVEHNYVKLVFGLAVFDLGKHQIPVEHCWVRTVDGLYYDPTYQKSVERQSLKTNYFSLIEINLDDYWEITLNEHKELGKVDSLDFMSFRRNERYSEFFLNQRPPAK